ncbi:MAG: DUF6382 domain-containing protein [Acetatifactor sp.]
MQTEFIKSLNCNYERVLLSEKPDDKRYQYCIISRGGIKGLLPCDLRYMDGQSYLYYDISSKQNVRQLYGTKCISREWVVNLFWSFRQMRQELERFLLDSANLLVFPEQIYQDLENETFCFIYLPYFGEENGFKQLMDFLIEHIDYEDDILVNCIYYIYEQLDQKGEVYLQSMIFEDLKKLEESTTKEQPSQCEEAVNEESEILCEEVVKQEEIVPKKHFFGIFDGRKKKDKEIRETYRQNMQEIMSCCRVAEDSPYEEEYGKTIYMEESKVFAYTQRRLRTPEGKVIASIDDTVLTLGKKKGEADAVLEDASVSRLHARIVREKDKYYIEDLNSTNGTFKNGLQLQPYEKRELDEGDEIRLGRVALIFE